MGAGAQPGPTMGHSPAVSASEETLAIPRVVAVVGPTAAGKSTLALRLAEAAGCRLFACDSVQVYRGMDIGSAKPDADERSRVPHEMIDLVDPDATFSAGAFARHAHERARLVAGEDAPRLVMCGGTGLYLRAFAWTSSRVEGGFDDSSRDGVGSAPFAADPASADPASADPSREDPERLAFEREWESKEAKKPGCAHAELQRIDAETAAGIHPNNVVRVLRALWLCRFHGAPISGLRAKDPPRLRVALSCIRLEPPAEQLRAQIFARCDAMMARGWLGEVEKLLAQGYDAELKSMQALGYKQLVAHLSGACTRDEAVDEIKMRTWQYARRQRTWFRHQLAEVPVTTVTNPDELSTADVRACLDFLETPIA